MRFLTRSVLFVLLFLSGASFAGKLSLTKQIIYLGQTPIKVITYKNSKPGNTYFHPHDNEKTALKAARLKVRRYGGKVITLSHGGRRLIRFLVAGQRYIVHPNRIFTSRGIRYSLRKCGPYSSTAYSAVRSFAKKLIKMLPKNIIIAVHNNTQHRYSSLSYRKGNKLAEDAKKLYANPKHDIDDFIYVTTISLYKALLPYKFNLVLQNRKTVVNDGSLSVYAVYHRIPHVNVEAEHGHLSRQLKMLAAVRAVSKGY